LYPPTLTAIYHPVQNHAGSPK